jgi:CrcB protein
MVWIAVGVGGALGSMARHAVNHITRAQQYPWGTAFVNLSGCFVIGLLAGLIASRRITMPSYWREFVFVGVLGGFTTFSTFGLDTFVLGRTHSPGHAALNVGVQVVGGLLAVWLGYRLSH